jgi:pimeloyl-ACP methyl ester carboxylesterase
MMEPQTQYAKTTDGVNIAYWKLGKGRPLLWLPMMLLGGSTGWRIEERRLMYERISATRQLVRLDYRGTGLSDSDVSDRSLEGHVRDVAAVVARLAAPRVDILAQSWSGPVGIACAAEFGEQASHLVLVNTAARGQDLIYKRFQALLHLAEQDFELFTETIAHAMVGWSKGEQARHLAAVVRLAGSSQSLRETVDVVRLFDATPFLERITLPTLVLQLGQLRAETAVVRELASRINNARLAVMGDESVLAYSDNLLGVIDAFLGEGEEQGAARKELPSGTAVILFADIADSTALTERLGDATFRAKARDLDAALRTVIRDHAGTPIEGKLLGDGVLAVFTSARQAIEAALACAKSATTRASPFTSASTPATSSARRTTSTAAP